LGLQLSRGATKGKKRGENKGHPESISQEESQTEQCEGMGKEKKVRDIFQYGESHQPGGGDSLLFNDRCSLANDGLLELF